MTAKLVVIERFGDGANVHFEDRVKSEASTIGGISDGYHTFDELYDHRCLLFLNLLQLEALRQDKTCWYSEAHHDGEQWEGWFIAGISDNGESVTYHLPMKFWPLAKNTFAAQLERAPEWDGHTSADVLQRLKSWVERG